MNDLRFVQRLYWFMAGLIVGVVIALGRFQPEERIVELPCVVVEVVDGRQPWTRPVFKPERSHP
jgi:hypothetical protein